MNSKKCENQVTTDVILELNNLMYLFLLSFLLLRFLSFV